VKKIAQNAKKEANYLPYEPQMEPSPPDKLNFKRTIIISLAFFTVLMAWSYFNFKIPLLLNEVLVNDLGRTNPFISVIIGTIMALDNIVAVILQPFFGDLSDRTKSKMGRRMPYIILGTAASAFTFTLIPLIRIIAGLIITILLFDIAMSIYRSASIAILPDYTSDKVYSKASAVQQFIANMGGLLGFAMPMIFPKTLFSKPTQFQKFFINIGDLFGMDLSYIVPSSILGDFLPFLTIAIIMIFLLVIQNVFLKETPTGDKFIQISENRLDIEPSTFKARELKAEGDVAQAKGRKKYSSYSEAFQIMKKHKDFAFFLGTVILMYLAFASVESFFSLFAQDYLGATEAQASTLFLFYSGPMIAVAYVVGLLGQSKKVGRKNAVKIFLIWLLCSLFVMTFIIVPSLYKNHNPLIMIIMLIMISVPWMGFIVNSFPILWELAPEGDLGIYTGIYYTFNQSAYALAPILFGGLLSAFSTIFTEGYKYIIMFPFIFICIITAFILFFKVKGGEAQDTQSAELLK
jgi:Na+/melibiose symporter-like transporter